MEADFRRKRCCPLSRRVQIRRDYSSSSIAQLSRCRLARLEINGRGISCARNKQYCNALIDSIPGCMNLACSSELIKTAVNVMIMLSVTDRIEIKYIYIYFHRSVIIYLLLISFVLAMQLTLTTLRLKTLQRYEIQNYEGSLV